MQRKNESGIGDWASIARTKSLILIMALGRKYVPGRTTFVVPIPA